MIKSAKNKGPSAKPSWQLYSHGAVSSPTSAALNAQGESATTRVFKSPRGS